MPERHEGARGRKVLAKDPLADLGELTGVLRRVRPAPSNPQARRPPSATLTAAPDLRDDPLSREDAGVRAEPPGPETVTFGSRPRREATPSGRNRLGPLFWRRTPPAEFKRTPVPGDAQGPAASGRRDRSAEAEAPAGLYGQLSPRDEREADSQPAESRPQSVVSHAPGRVRERLSPVPETPVPETPPGPPAWRRVPEDARTREPEPALRVLDATEVEQRYEEAKRSAAQGEYDSAIQAYLEVLRHNPAHVRARNNLGFAYDCRGDHDLAVNEYVQALELDPQNVQVQCNLGAAYGAKGWYGKAEELLKTAVRLDPKSAEAHCNLGIVYCKKGLYHLATAELKRAIELDEKNVQAFYYLGDCYNHLDRLDDAMGAFERTLERQPQNHKALYNLGILFDKKNMPERAKLMYRRAREMQRGGASAGIPADI